MKKIATVLILSLMLVSGSCAFAQEKKELAIKKMFNKVSQQLKNQQDASSEDVFTSDEQATLLYNSNELVKAFDVILAIPEADRTAQDWVLLGNILQDQDKISDATFMYQRAILINPNFYKPYYNLANIYLNDEKPFMAIDNYKKAIKAKPDFAYAYYNLGCAYLRLGDLNKAKLHFIKAIELKNTESDFHYNLAYTYKKLNKPKQAKQYLEFYNKIMESKGE